MSQVKSKRKLRKENIYHAADFLMKKLTESDVVVQRYNSQSSQSVYLKLDYGVLGTIRISDHKENDGKEYKYNMLTEYRNVVTTEKDFKIKHHFPLWEKQLLLKIILDDREEKISKYSINDYETLMDIAIAKYYFETGYWQNSNIK